MKGLEGCGRAEGRPGQSHRIEEYAGTAAALHHTQIHAVVMADVSGAQGVHANVERMARHRLTQLNYTIDLYQQHVKDNTLEASYGFLHVPR